MNKLKYRRSWTEKSIDKRIKNGYGQGYRESYIPWLKIQDVPSSGVVKRVKGIKISRVYHFMSLLEYQYFCLLEWSERVKDIREQFPLFHREDAQYIAEQKGIAYPVYPKTLVPIVMTSDFAIQFNENYGKTKEVIRTVKPSNELNNRRVLNKLEIEREYWNLRGFDWGIVTEKDIDPTLLYNISFFRGASHIKATNHIEELIYYFVDYLLNNREKSIIEIITILDKKHKQEPGTFLSIFKYLISKRLIK